MIYWRTAGVGWLPVWSKGSSCKTGRRKSSPSQGKDVFDSLVRQEASGFYTHTELS